MVVAVAQTGLFGILNMFEILKRKVPNLFKNPGAFVARQVYRVVLVFPYSLLVKGLTRVRLIGRLPNGLEPASHCFFITSVIYPIPNKVVSYGGVRSGFSPEDRAAQTRQTIESIRRYVPDARVILIEAGHEEVLPASVENLADQYIYVGKNRLVRWACDSKIKSLGEVMMILAATKKFKFVSEYYFKMSGRYYLNENFTLSDWHQAGIMFYPIRPDYYSTRLYGFSREYYGVWKKMLWLGLPFNAIDYAIENTVSKTVSAADLRTLTKLGVAGLSGSTREVIEE